MDITNKLFVEKKHRAALKNKKPRRWKQWRRYFYEPEELDKALDRAKLLAQEDGMDYVVVQVLAEASKSTT